MVVSPPLDARQAWLQLAADAAALPCTRLEAEPAASDLRLELTAGDPALAERLAERIRTTPGLALARQQTLDPGSPLCRAFDTLARLTRPSPRRMVRLEEPLFATCAGGGCYRGLADHRLAEGERLTLRVEAPDFPSHLTVDYLMADGHVFHLWPAPAGAGQPETVAAEGYALARAPGSELWLGDIRAGPDAPAYPIGPPFGRELILVLASPTPLFTRPRPALEPIADYLGALEAALARAEQGGARPLASALPILTGPGGR